MSAHDQRRVLSSVRYARCWRGQTAHRSYLRPLKGLAQGWVEHKEAAAGEEQMALARQAVKDAKWANWIALWALVIAAISLIVAVLK